MHWSLRDLVLDVLLGTALAVTGIFLLDLVFDWLWCGDLRGCWGVIGH